MRKLLLLFFSVVSLVAMAANVTPNEALRQAQQFLQKQGEMSGRRSAGVLPQLKLAGTVSDLYVFNAEDRQGFVIVSNDDCAVPVLGYSETGAVDIQNIPDNMRAWLQGYADEIAWAKQHKTMKVKNMPPRTLRTAAIKSPIAPMMQTHWSQGAPYNNLCPDYETGNKSVTGCVATAMAQCMYFTEMRVGSTTTFTTAEIPAYTSIRYSIPIDAVAAGTPINWSLMAESYSSADVSSAATAVAELMLYCGASVQMDYGPSSGALSQPVADVLKYYFGYNTTTTQYVSRSDYTYANWIEMMYHELSQGRVIFYGGESSGGGHAFVCDGYQGEDYFHINWGWGGMSDNYFKLSALDPDAQGIGGSSSSDGYHYGQEAVIGIQKSTESGSVLEVEESNWGLMLTGLSINKSSITAGETVEVTVSLKNTYEGDYDGDVRLNDDNGYGLVTAKVFVIPAGGSKDCVLSFTPVDETHTYSLRPVVSVGGNFYYVGTSSVTLNVTGTGAVVTNNVDLNVTNVSVDNYYAGNFYGTTLKGTITVSNPESDKTYSGNYEWGLFNSEGNKLLAYGAKNITIPANGSFTLPFEVPNREFDTGYFLAATYVKNDTWADWTVLGLITCKAAIISYDASGNTDVSLPSSSVTVPAAATSVDLTGCGVTTVTPNANPNTLYILGMSDATPAGLTEANIVSYDGANYTASSISLTDGQDFYSPVNFTATNIEFTYNNTKQADGTGGWSTIMLPFDVEQVTANGTPISWFTSATDSGKDFWLKEFTSDEASTVNFAYTSTMKANTPYIIALPGDHWGPEYNLIGKTIKFIGTNAEVSKTTGTETVTGGNYRFMGSTTQVTTPNIYCLNDAGTSFALKATGGSPAFRAFFKPGIFDRTVEMLRIGSEPGGGTTGIANVRSKTQDADGDFFNLKGQRVAHPTKGLYIVNGKKVVVK